MSIIVKGVCKKQLKNLSQEEKDKIISHIHEFDTLSEIEIGRKKLIIRKEKNGIPVLLEIKHRPFLHLDDKQLSSIGIPKRYFRHVREATDLREIENLNIPRKAKEKLQNYLEFHDIYKENLNRIDYEAEDEDHLKRFLREDIVTLLLHLTDEQKKIAYKITEESPIIVKGCVGSGKTTIALYRARYFAKQGDRVLYLTYNKSLTKAAEVLLYDIDGCNNPNIEIKTLHNWCVAFLESKKKKIYPPSQKYRKEKIKEYIKIAVNEIKIACLIESLEKGKNLNPIFDKDYNFWENEIRIIKEIARKDKQYYLNLERKGLPQLTGEQKEIAWKVFEKYEEIKNESFISDWSDVLLETLDYIKENGLEDDEKYDHVIVDEVQDINRIGLEIITKLAKRPNGIIFFGDIAQSIYNTGFRWKNVGVFVSSKNVYKLEKSFRNTKSILLAARGLLQDLILEESFILPIRTVKEHGEKPEIIKFKNNYNQIEWVARHIKGEIDKGRAIAKNIAVLCRIKKYLLPLKRKLEELGLSVSYYQDNVDMNADTIKLLTFHSAKGLEFPMVYIIRVDEGIVPLERNIKDRSIELQERKLLYVAMTRAMDRLIITCSYNRPSPFLRYINEKFVRIKNADEDFSNMGRIIK